MSVIPMSANDLEAVFRRAECVRLTTVEPDYESFTARSELLARVADEMLAQDDRWGQQDHPFNRWGDRSFFAEEAEGEKRSNDILGEAGQLDWRGILAEEVYEALAEDDENKAIAELVQVAAVALQAAASIYRNGLGGAA